MVGFIMKSTCILLKNVSSWHVVVFNLLEELILLVVNMDHLWRRMTSLSTEILGLRYQGDAGQAFHDSCF